MENNNINGREHSGLKFIKELTEAVNQNKTLEEILHFVNISFDLVFGATAIMFVSIKNNKEIKIIISRGISHEYTIKNQLDPSEQLIKTLIEISNNNKSFYTDFKENLPELNSVKTINFEHSNIKELYIYPLFINMEEHNKNNESMSVIIYSVNGFKNYAEADGSIKNTFDIIFSILSYIIKAKKCDESILECSKFDHTSGLYNFKYFHQRLFEEMQKINSEKGIMSIALMSINKLNEFNSLSGHAAGDAAINFIGGSIQKYVRTYDIAARFGNKIIICFPDLSKTDTKKIIENIFLEVQDHFIKQNNNIISMNAGIAQYPDDGSTERIVVDLAESRRFEARRNLKWNII
ncbi:MAG: GGDEF domain-containing protein [Candidatus Acididesulfobacter diazotrophicus]|jgi:diguanylate cyclase (GGDEF)-like protein|uniref:GGDEF domain-containing protein n=1 Tax=Candidatus Acididesulfobacter diazotrophicus TaxID=2597226 RepID=A0A519BMD4_9DELT|nr:MAG: GGDEF domain-containing protein [Candidatus Acididesulfobacter diazotrophicus]